MMQLFLAVLVLLSAAFIDATRNRKLEEPTCKDSDYYYDFTECDASRGRWRVALPVPGCEGLIPTIPPKRLDECYKSCEAGQFLNLATVQCEECSPGTYSLGGGLRFDEWDPLPDGFKTQVEKFHSVFSTFGRQYSSVNCSKWGWRPKGDVILSQGGPCVATLVYSAELLRPGRLRFMYSFPEDESLIFQFQANSDQCESIQEAEASRWPPVTGEGNWRTEEISLRTGLNIFQFKTMGIDSSRPKPIMIKKIEIEGVGYTPACLPCSGGMWNDKSGADECKLCPKNTYSHRNSTTCSPCSQDEYSEAGATTCKKRPLCSTNDYYQLHTPCNQFNQTQTIFKWVEPKICLGLPGAVDLPPAGPFKECPPCNPGTEYIDGTCVPCSGNQFSDGLTPCTECPRNTAPDKSHHLTQWYSNWPPNVHATCISPEDSGCNQSPPWQLSGNHVRSGKGHADWVYLVLTLTVEGFRGIGGMINGQLLEVGTLQFSFEMNCKQDCELLLMQGTSSRNATVIQRWIGTHPKQEFTHKILKNDSYSFSFAFQKVPWDSASPEGNLRDDWSEPASSWVNKDSSDDETVAKIYSIHVSNTIDGGAERCEPCQNGFIYSQIPINTSDKGCVTCSPGHYRTTVPPPAVTGNSSSTNDTSANSGVQCVRCPRNSVTIGPYATNCTKCGPGLISNDGQSCTTDCLIRIGGYTYDLRPLKGFHTVRGSPLFTASGTQYYHSYNISFCMDTNARCYKNVSLPHGYDNQSQRVEALICQSTIFPTTVTSAFAGMGAKPLSTHAGSLGDHLIGISHSPSILPGLSAARVVQDNLEFSQQFHFFYSTSEPTPACSKGRSSTITFRCRMPSTSWAGVHTDSPGAADADIKIPEKCPDGTCDGCNYHLIWETPFACHVCAEDELIIVRGECKDGFQEMHYLSSPNSLCLLKHNSSWPHTVKCKNHLPFVVQISIQLTIGATVLLTAILICFWRRHRRLEYKYMKLVASGTNHEGFMGNSGETHQNERDMLPVAESCAIENDGDDDEEEHFNVNGDYRREPSQSKEVSFYSDSALKNLVSKFSVFNRIKSLSRKGNESGSSLEIMNLTDKEALT